MASNFPSNKQTKTKNQRYTATAHPKHLSLSEAKKKANKFAAKNDKSLRVGAKRAILRELNSHLVVKAQGIFPSSENTENPYARGQTTSTQTKTRSEKPTVTQTIKSRDYTWDKNGRHEEIKIRYIARKYLLLWIRNVYGRVHPFTARCHYEHCLKVKVIQTWQDIWWTGRKGWKLNIRAEYHNRYRTWVQVWRAWRSYVLMQRAKNLKHSVAINHANRVVQAKWLAIWKRYIANKRIKNEKYKQASERDALSTKRLVWQKWTEEIVKRKTQIEMEHSALKFWAITLIAKTWSRWIAVWDEHRLEKRKMDFARERANRRLMNKVWIYWKNYITVKKLKHIQNRVAVHHFSVTLTSKALCLWYTRWQRNNEIAQFTDLIEYKGNTARLRRVTAHWKFYVEIQQQRQLDKALAFDHYLRNLKRTCLLAMCQYKSIRDQKYLMGISSQEFWHKLQLRRVWRRWLKRCEHSEELKIYPLTRKARTLFRVTLLQKMFNQWQCYRRWRKYRTTQYNMADNHYNKTILPRYLHKMQLFVDIMKEKRSMQYEGDQFRREVLLSLGYYTWYNEYQLTVDVKMMTRMGILHHDDSIKVRYLKLWRRRTRQQLHEHSLEVRADDHYVQQLLIKAITEWKNYTRGMVVCRYYHQVAVRHYYNTILHKIWLAWTKYVERREAKWRRQAIADIHYQHRIMRMVLHHWKVYNGEYQSATSTANQRFYGHQIARLRWAMSAWHHFVSWHKRKIILNHRAKNHYRSIIMKKVVLSWHSYACQHVVKREEEAIECREKQAVLNQGKLHRSFQVWVQITKASVHKKSLYCKSEHHYHKKLLIKMVSAWRQFLLLKVRIQLLQRQSQWLHNQRITAAFFRSWKCQYRKSVQTRKKTSLSLWHWSVTLQRKVFQVWLQYAILKKHKEARIAQALDQRRTRLIKTGVIQWIKVAFHQSSLRNQYAQERHVQQAHNIHQFVYKCALHWRKWASQRAELRKQHGNIPVASNAKTSALELGDRHLAKNMAPPTTKEVFKAKELLPDLFKTRPKPRVPDYLRESYDVSSINDYTQPTDRSSTRISYGSKPPNLASTHTPTHDIKLTDEDSHSKQSMRNNKTPVRTVSDMTLTINNKLPISAAAFSFIHHVDDTPCPRPPPPPPDSQVQPHPRERSFTDDSVVMSDGEGWGSASHRAASVKLLPPSSFEVPSRSTGDIGIPETKVSGNRPYTILTNDNVKAEIFEARTKLQEHYNLKLKHRDARQCRDELFKAFMADNSNADLKQKLDKIEEELESLSDIITQNTPAVEQLAIKIQQLIERLSKT